MRKFNEILKEFDNTLRVYNYENYLKLQDPLSEEEIINYLRIIGLEDCDVFSLYKWKNGVINSSNISMLFSYECNMLSLNAVLEYKTKGVPLKNYNSQKLIMLFDNGEDCFLFNSNKGNSHGTIHLYSVSLLSIEKPKPYFDSLSSMLETTINQYKHGGLIYDNITGSLISNTEINIKVYNQFNTKSDFYNREL